MAQSRSNATPARSTDRHIWPQYPAGDSRFTFGVIVDLASTLAKHGYYCVTSHDVFDEHVKTMLAIAETYDGKNCPEIYLTGRRVAWDLVLDLFDVLERHGYRMSDDSHVGRAIALLVDFTKSCEVEGATL